jgi:hypothetical protein
VIFFPKINKIITKIIFVDIVALMAQAILVFIWSVLISYGFNFKFLQAIVSGSVDNDETKVFLSVISIIVAAYHIYILIVDGLGDKLYKKILHILFVIVNFTMVYLVCYILFFFILMYAVLLVTGIFPR